VKEVKEGSAGSAGSEGLQLRKGLKERNKQRDGRKGRNAANEGSEGLKGRNEWKERRKETCWVQFACVVDQTAVHPYQMCIRKAGRKDHMKDFHHGSSTAKKRPPWKFHRKKKKRFLLDNTLFQATNQSPCSDTRVDFPLVNANLNPTTNCTHHRHPTCHEVAVSADDDDLEGQPPAVEGSRNTGRNEPPERGKA
jgi:hypothetical protein